VPLTIHAEQRHLGWDNSIPPVAVVAAGSEVVFEVPDASGGQLGPSSTADDIASLDPAGVNPVTGPILVVGAEPGDALRVTFRAFEPAGWGWTAIIPGFGLLAEDFADPALHLWEYDPADGEPAHLGDVASIPLRPFPGTIGVAPAAPGRHSVIPPRSVGGNLDTRDLVEGAVLWLPVEVPGALLSIGDTHAAQGDGEVCGTAIESPMTVVVQIDVERGAPPPAPRRPPPRGGAGAPPPPHRPPV
jgi:acetamidase/formamidase